ncbi:MAG: 7-cyano-7-deazaguanine synthase [Nitrospirae bacterium]|nr:7-cyano-7-deazaguanine synthase [Nitrospirota bacterium]
MKDQGTNVHTFQYNALSHSNHKDIIRLDYRTGPDKNVTLRIPKLIENVIHIPARYLDLLDLASYVYCADRFIKRGSKNSPYFTGWRRHFKHIVHVRDNDFWSDSAVVNLLIEALSFMSGDIHEFEFIAGHSTPKVHMFDGEEFLPPPSENLQVALFSGGLDSTCGAYDILNNTDKNLILASHVSQPGSKKTQRLLADELKRIYPNRVHHIIFECNLSHIRAPEETQRTRAFLYTAVGATIAKAYGQSNMLLFENGILSINLPPNDQYQNARATRTTHPKSLYYLSELITLINENQFKIDNPFFWLTKTDTVLLLKRNHGISLLNNTVSCSRTYDRGLNHTHCGRCSQCIDRRFAVAAADMLEDEDRAIYARDFVIDNICADNDDNFGREERTMLVDYIRIAMSLRNQNEDAFYDRWLDHLTDVIDFIDGFSETDNISKLHNLFYRHGKQVMAALHSFTKKYEDEMLGKKSAPNSLSEILDKKEYLDEPWRLLANKIFTLLSTSIPIAFQSHMPKNEEEVKDYAEAFFKTNSDKIEREFPHIQFALGTTVPDFSRKAPCLYVEIKYLRGKTTPSKVSGGIAEDCTKYPNDAFLLFIIYDPQRKVKDDEAFTNEFERKRECIVKFIR